MLSSCPGAVGIKGTPTLKIKACPECGHDIEIFSSDVQIPCANCGFCAHNDTMTCINWCQYAKECVGEELYNRFHRQVDMDDEQVQ